MEHRAMAMMFAVQQNLKYLQTLIIILLILKILMNKVLLRLILMNVLFLQILLRQQVQLNILKFLALLLLFAQENQLMQDVGLQLMSLHLNPNGKDMLLLNFLTQLLCQQKYMLMKVLPRCSFLNQMKNVRRLTKIEMENIRVKLASPFLKLNHHV